jgi:hypothetical protein
LSIKDCRQNTLDTKWLLEYSYWEQLMDFCVTTS